MAAFAAALQFRIRPLVFGPLPLFLPTRKLVTIKRYRVVTPVVVAAVKGEGSV
ncbi:hypothetical protein CCACVL1_08121 [Corchorus capsularis]|uniref:Uncharacterized protein n=1 Tax=Corchorus capsularis TaxID=210143 RepID=A0A1R3J255_COCAP|nr:hypothetical protein CCACVL1_08121 [Corchorus capsularis]